MPKYEVKTPRERYELESDKIESDILKKEDITYKVVVDEAPEACKLRFLRQNDPKWGNTTIGNTKYTLARYGCTITSLSELSSWYCGYKSPDVLAKELQFNNNGEILWQSIDKVLPYNFVYRYYSYDKDKLLEILRSEHNAAIVRVPFAGAAHWLTLIGYNNILGFRCIDPLRGDATYVSTRYGKINGFTELTRKK